jgi:hypothetical protein
VNAPYPYVQADPAAIRSKDEGDLNTLSILHYVWTALLGCSTLGIVAYFLLIAGVVADSGRGHGTGHEAAAAGIVLLIGVFIALFTVPVVVLHFVAAAGLKKHTRYILIMVMAGFTCLSFPLGTALGVWTFMVLGRPSVKALFGRA